MSMLNALILCEPPNNKKLVADWTPKAGCTIAMKMLFTYMNVLDEALEYKSPRKWVHDFRQDVYYERFGRVTEKHMKSSEYIKLKFVRNPFNRAVSSYIHCCKHPSLLDEYKDSNPSFNDFLKLLHSKKLGINCGGGHYRVQNWELDRIYNETIKIENLNEHIDKINVKYNINLKTNFSSGHHVKKNDKYIKNFGSVNRNEVLNYFECNNQESPTYSSYYSDENYEMVSEIYANDIEPLEYHFDLK